MRWQYQSGKPTTTTSGYNAARGGGYLRFDLRVVPPESYGNLLQHFTGSKHHNVALREDAVRRGYSGSEYSVTEVESGEEHTFAEEAGG